MYKDVQAQDKETRDSNMDKLAEDVKAYFVEKYGEEKEKHCLAMFKELSKNVIVSIKNFD